jgi:5'-nucleotidase
MLKHILSTTALALVAGTASADMSLTILHTNDFHDRFEPISAFDSGCSAEDNAAGDCFGGVGRMVTAVADARARAENPAIFLDAGDWFQGTLFYTQYGGDVAAEFMTILDYDVMAVGNHEFDDGPQGLSDFVDQVGFPVISANIDVSQNNLLADKIGKSTVLDVDGERIGIVSVLAEDTAETSSPGDTVIFSPIVDGAQAEVDRLTDDGVNKIILLTHVGFAADRRLAEQVTGVDLIIGGHSHTLLSNTDENADGPYPTVVNDVPIFQAYSYGKYLGEIDVTFDDDGNVTDISGDPILLDGSVAEDADAVARVAELAGPLEELRQMVIGEAADSLEGDRSVCRVQECAMGNLVAEAMLDRVGDQGVQIAITNSGGVRASIDAGEVTMGEVYTVLPFQNTLSTFEVTGQTLIDALENGASKMEEVAGRFPQVAGMSFSVDPAAEVGSRISEVMVGDEAIDPEATYMVASNNYVRNGGDGYAMFRDAENAYDFGPDLAEVVADYIGENSPVAPMTDGRITVK